MRLTTREFWTALHGMMLGAAFLLAFAGCAVSLWSLRSEWVTPAGVAGKTRLLVAGCWSMAILSWLTVLIGTFVIYPWYRAAPPKDASPAVLAGYPKAVLISQPQTKEWHEFGMEWKEHVGWLVPIFATAVAIVACMYRGALAHERIIRRTMLVLLTLAFFAASAAGLFGALINKMAPVR
jgi:hypothetical protein